MKYMKNDKMSDELCEVICRYISKTRSGISANEAKEIAFDAISYIEFSTECRQFVKEMNDLEFPEILAQKMRENHETAYRLAKELRVSQSTIANWLTGRSYPQLALIEKLEEHYKCSFPPAD